MTDPALDRDKAEARRRARAIRSVAADPMAGVLLAKKFPEALAGARTVAGYWPLGSEIDPRPLMMMLAMKGARIVLPHTASRSAPPSFHLWRDGDALAPDSFGILAPAASAEQHEPNMILTPLLAFDRAGHRLGQGGGHYDRILALLKPKGVLAIGLAFSAQEVDEVPAGAHDQKLDWVITEKEAIRTGA